MNINISAPINNTGYGIASINLIKELSLSNNLSLFNIGPSSVDTQEDYDLILKLIVNQEYFDIHAPYIKIWHQFDLAQRIGRGKYFAYPFFELDTFNEREIKHLSVPDEIFVSSVWAKEIIEKNHIKTQTNVIPLGVNTSIFNPKNYKQKNKDKYTFINIGKWEVRKGHDFIYEIFKKAFPFDKNVELIICASEFTNAYSSKEEIAQWKAKYSNDPRIRIIPGVQSHKDIAEIISYADCGLFPSRAEGWNLELLECMAMDKPCIATNYSAHTEFCNPNNCYLINIDSLEPAFDGKAFQKQGNWAKIGNNQFDQMIEYMRLVYFKNIRNNPDGLKTATNYSWQNSAQKISGCII